MALIEPVVGRSKNKISKSVNRISLTGMPSSWPIHTADGDTTIEKIRVIYNTAAAITGSEGTLLYFGTYADPNKFAIWESALTATAGSVHNVSVHRIASTILEDETLVVTMSSGRKNAGNVNIQVEMSEVR